MVVLLNSDCLLPIKHLSEIYHSPKSRFFCIHFELFRLAAMLWHYPSWHKGQAMLHIVWRIASHQIGHHWACATRFGLVCAHRRTDLQLFDEVFSSLRLCQRYCLVRGTFCNEEDVCLSDLIINNYLVASQSFLCDWLVATKLTVRRIASKIWNNLP